MKEYKDRLRLLLFGFLFLFFILFLRVGFLTFFNRKGGDARPDTKVHRGIIFDRRGTELAISQDSSTIGVNPEEIYDPAFTASKLAKFIDVPEKKIEDLILEKDKYFLLKREIDNAHAKKIMEMSLPGVRLEKEFKRVYPNGTLASNLIGFTGMDDNKALAGIEYMFNEELLSRTDKDLARGYDIHLTVDSLIQFRLESALGKAFKDTQSKRAVGIFMDVQSGRILAMANFPNFNPNRYWDYPAESTTNWAMRHVYEPGSTMKIFIASILLNQNLIDLNEKFFCPGYVEFGDRLVRCSDQHGLVDLDEILQHSCNVGIIKATKKLPDDVLFRYLKKFKFGQKTGLSSVESKGFFPALKDWTPSTSYYMAIGQGIEVTPLQLVTSAAGLVNGGRIHTPILVSHITDAYGDVVKQYNENPDLIEISESTTNHILRAMTKVVKLGTGKNAYLQDYSIAGKTGTAQKAKPGKGYVDGLLSASFLGFFPAEKPKVVGLILFDEPGSALHSGGGIAAPVFKEVIENIVPILDFTEQANSYKLPKLTKKEEETKSLHVPNFTGKTVKESIAIFQKHNVKYKVYGSGFCVRQKPGPGEPIRPGDTWTLYFE